ncbi:MAG: mechanosensitive ion channel family protein [Gammaproteobacteria bacterium]|nr:mechanosensitive ion channel family protein [Gammaproteobacteria bacterium]MDH5650584.1 mechanosensitive ion channel family protein [Gammaproteobacteria bacterium]
MPTQSNNLQGDVLSGLQPIIGFFGNYPFMQSLVILVLFLFIAYATRTVLSRVLGKMAERTKIKWDDHVVGLLQRPIFLTVLLLGLLTAVLPLKFPADLVDVVQSIVATVLIVAWTRFLMRLSQIMLAGISKNTRTQSLIKPQTRPLFENLGFILIIIIAIYFVFRAWNIDMTAWLASAGILGIAIGFAAKDTLANLFSGVFILADAPYKLGDYIVLDTGERGKVTAIGLRSTRLLTRDDVEITIPNAIMGNSRITNQSGGPYEKFRIRIKVGVAYGSDIDQVKAVLVDVANMETQVCRDPEPRVRFRVFGASSLDLELLCWVDNPELRGRVMDALNTQIYKRFKAEGIEIPYSKHDVFIKEMPK